MAKTALVNKAARKPKFKVRGYTRCQRCGRPHSVYRKFGLCRICFREMAHRASSRASPRAAGNSHPLHDLRNAVGPPRKAGGNPGEKAALEA